MVLGVPDLINSSINCDISAPCLQVKVILPVAFFEKFALLFSTSIETLVFDSFMPFIIKSPVVSSAAIPWTAQNIDLNGFWLIHRCFTLTSQVVSVTFVVRIPVQKTEGNL